MADPATASAAPVLDLATTQGMVSYPAVAQAIARRAPAASLVDGFVETAHSCRASQRVGGVRRNVRRRALRAGNPASGGDIQLTILHALPFSTEKAVADALPSYYIVRTRLVEPYRAHSQYSMMSLPTSVPGPQGSRDIFEREPDTDPIDDSF